MGAVFIHFGHGNPQEEEGKAVRVEDSGGRGKASGEAQRRRALDSLPPQARGPSEVGLLTGGGGVAVGRHLEGQRLPWVSL